MIRWRREPYPFDQAIVWHAVFHPGRSLWGRRFRHVSLAGFSNDTWLHLDLARGGVNVAMIYHHEEARFFLEYLCAGFTVLRVGPARESSPMFGWPMTCTAFVAHVLGVRGALVPDRLFRILLAQGAEVINAEARGEPRAGGGAQASAGPAATGC